jgi:archaemetzincin
MSSGSAAGSIALAPMGGFSADILGELSAGVRAAFERDVLIAGRLEFPSSAFDRSRDQWRASSLLRVLGPAKRPEWDRLLGIVEIDLYAPGLNFVFGQADERHGVAVFSTARLAAGHAERPTLVRRASIEAVHELGHTYGLRHCSRPDCVMWFSNTLGETDRKGFAFCEQHALELKRSK